MAQDLGLDFAAGPTVTLLSSDLTDGSQSAFTATVDFGNPAPIAFGHELILTTLTGTTGPVTLQVAWSHDNSDFSDANNVQNVVTATMAASTDNEAVGSSAVMAQYAKFRLDNQSGGTVDGTSSNTALILTDIFGDQS